MTTPEKLIRIVEEAGGSFKIDGDRLGVTPVEAAAPVREQLIEHKEAVLRLLSQRTMPAGVRLISWQLKTAPVQLSQCEAVVDVELFVRTTLKQLAATLHGNFWTGGNWGLVGLIDRLEAVGVVVELTDPKRAEQ